MTIAPDNKVLQDEVESQTQAIVGGVAQDRETLAFDFDAAVADDVPFGYGEIVDTGASNGAAKISASTTADSILGVVPFLNAGIIDFEGYSKPMYTNIMLLRRGVMWLATGPSETINVGGDVHLMVDPDSGDEALLGLLFASSQAGTIDVSQLFKVVRNVIDDLILVEVRAGENV